MLLKAAGCIVSYWFEQMNYTYKKIWLIAFPVMMSILIEQLINITDALPEYGSWQFICLASGSV